MHPEFLGIGAQKAGTSWLYSNLRKHPDLWLPPIKELHYFNYRQNNYLQRRIDKIKNKRWQNILKAQLKEGISNKNFEHIRWVFKYFLSIQNDSWYASLFEPGREKVAGEITPDYASLNKDSVKHIYEVMPDLKIIFMLRNPIERAWSYTFSHIKKDGEEIDSLSVSALIDRCTSSYSRSRGNYQKTLKIWQSYYPENQFFIGFFEEIKENPVDLLYKISSFLSVDFPEEYIKVIDARKVYSFGNTGDIPCKVRRELAGIYYEEIEYLSSRYGRYADQWLSYADECLECS